MRILLKLYANLNLGDDLFLKILIERYPHVKFVLPAPNNYKKVFKHYKNLEIIEDAYEFNTNFIQRVYSYLERRFFLSKYIKKIEEKYSKNFVTNNTKFDAFISIGGSIFMQRKKLPVYNSVLYYKLAKQYCENTFYLGCNFGPYKDLKFLKDYKEIFFNAEDVCFREKLSYDLFSDIHTVRYKPDIVFGFKYPKIIKKNKTVGFSIVSARNGVRKEDYLKKYSELINYYNKKDYNVYLFSFCEAQGDGDTINSILDMVNEPHNINKVVYNGNIDEFLTIYSSMEQMFCGRFHAMILSMIFEQKIFPIMYSSKMANVLNDMNFKGTSVNLFEFLKVKSSEVFKQISLNSYDIKGFKEEGQKQFEKLDLFIAKNLKK